jgi:hypothetical protein
MEESNIKIGKGNYEKSIQKVFPSGKFWYIKSF